MQPTLFPTGLPSTQPSRHPSSQSSLQPSMQHSLPPIVTYVWVGMAIWFMCAGMVQDSGCFTDELNLWLCAGRFVGILILSFSTLMMVQFLPPDCDTLYDGVLLPTYFWTTISTVTFVGMKYSFQFIVYSVRKWIELNLSQERNAGSTYRIVPLSSAGSCSILRPGIIDSADIGDNIEMREHNDEHHNCKHDDDCIINGDGDVENVLAGWISPKRKPIPMVRIAPTTSSNSDDEFFNLRNEYLNLPVQPKFLDRDVTVEENDKLKENNISERQYKEWVNIFDPEVSNTSNNHIDNQDSANQIEAPTGLPVSDVEDRRRLTDAVADDRASSTSSTVLTPHLTYRHLPLRHPLLHFVILCYS